MRYNPYGWKIIKKEENCDEVYTNLLKINSTDCILNELGRVCTQLYFKKEEFNDIKKKYHEVEKEILDLEEKKINIITKLYQE